jgi:hypothetical protein
VIVVSFQQLDILGFGAAGAKSVHAMGCIFSRETVDQGDIRDTIQAREIDKRIAQQSTAEKKVQKLLLLGAGESGKSTIFKQIKVLFQTGFDDSEKKNYTSVVHANAYQSIKILLDGLQEFSESEQEKYTLLPENKAIGEKLTEIGNRTQQPPLTEELAQQIEALWKDPAIQVKLRKLKAALHKQLNWMPLCTYFLFTHLQAKQTEDVQSGITFDQASVV